MSTRVIPGRTNMGGGAERSGILKGDSNEMRYDWNSGAQYLVRAHA
ncbi:hypothetical protein [Arthrobacter sp. USHLN218]